MRRPGTGDCGASQSWIAGNLRRPGQTGDPDPIEGTAEVTQPIDPNDHVLTVDRHGPVLNLTLNRPDRRNALARVLIHALTEAFSQIDDADGIRVVVLTGAGPVFCAGGDISEYAQMKDLRRATEDATALSTLLTKMRLCPVPIIAAVHGAAYGGGVGLVCAVDIAIASATSKFSLSETRLGLVPATIGPYVVQAIGRRAAQARTLVAAPFDANEALRIGLIHEVVDDDHVGSAVSRTVDHILMSPPGALASAKRMIDSVANSAIEDVSQAMVDLIVERRGSEEGQEGMAAFLQRRRASWVPDDNER